jgi:hypothetical protein
LNLHQDSSNFISISSMLRHMACTAAAADQQLRQQAPHSLSMAALNTAAAAAAQQ